MLYWSSPRLHRYWMSAVAHLRNRLAPNLHAVHLFFFAVSALAGGAVQSTQFHGGLRSLPPGPILLAHPGLQLGEKQKKFSFIT